MPKREKTAQSVQSESALPIVASRIVTVLVWLVAAIAVVVMVFTIFSVTAVDKADTSAFGFQAFIVSSSSMSATDFEADDLIFVRTVEPSTLQPGDIISFRSAAAENYNEVVTHKIRELTTAEDGEPGFITYGTTTGADDQTIVTYDRVLGRYCAHIPKVGLFFQFLKTTPGYVVCILLPFLLLFMLQGLHTLRLLFLYRKEQLAKMAAEREKIEAERAENQRVLTELQTLRAQLAAQPTDPGVAVHKAL